DNCCDHLGRIRDEPEGREPQYRRKHRLRTVPIQRPLLDRGRTSIPFGTVCLGQPKSKRRRNVQAVQRPQRIRIVGNLQNRSISQIPKGRINQNSPTMSAKLKGALHLIVNLGGNVALLALVPDEYKAYVVLAFNICAVLYAYL